MTMRERQKFDKIYATAEAELCDCAETFEKAISTMIKLV